MSTDDQQYSIPCQQAAIRHYAENHGMTVCRSYVDQGKSGVLLKHRKGLAQLLQDVVSGEADYRAVLVYDVSRWGRFQNPDESAYYDFVCANAGIPIHYCAEQFSNDGSIQSKLMKAIKRTMAAEFSRELGDKVHAAMKRLVQQGFHAGGPTPYGFERMLISPSGRRKGILKTGVLKNLKRDKVILVPGKKVEIACVRRIFSMCANEKKNCVQIATALNAQDLRRRGRPWTCDNVRNVIHRVEYSGMSVWGRRTKRLHCSSTLQPKSAWVSSEARFRRIIDQHTFDRAQRVIANQRPVGRTSEAMLAALRRLFARKQRLSCRLIDKSRLCEHSSRYIARFGSLLNVYGRVGFKPSSSCYAASKHGHSHRRLYDGVVQQLKELFPDHVRIVDAYRSRRGVIEVDGEFRISILICGKRSHPYNSGRFPWVLRVSERDRNNIGLVCIVDPNWNGILGYYVIPPLRRSVGRTRLFARHTWLTRSGRRLATLNEFLDGVSKVSSAIPPIATTMPTHPR